MKTNKKIVKEIKKFLEAKTLEDYKASGGKCHIDCCCDWCKLWRIIEGD